MTIMVLYGASLLMQLLEVVLFSFNKQRHPNATGELWSGAWEPEGACLGQDERSWDTGKVFVSRYLGRAAWLHHTK